MMTLREIARALGGEVSGTEVIAPGPGHSKADRSLSIRLSANSPDGFVAHSFAGAPSDRLNIVEKAEKPAARTRANGGEQRSYARRTQLVFKSVANLCSEYVPLAYAVDGLIRTASLYTLTGKTGSGKTGFNVASALANATGRANILGREVACGRVAYCAAENPDDVRMRFMIAAFLLNIDLNELGDKIIILERRAKPEDIATELAKLAETGPFVAVYVDTLAAYYDGDKINDPIQAGNFGRRWRPLTWIPGKPAVVISSYPVKNAAEDQLIPYGSGAILNEVDGNLTLWKTDAGVSVHRQGKLRGIEFEPPQFRFEMTSSPDVLDAKGREILLPTLPRAPHKRPRKTAVRSRYGPSVIAGDDRRTERLATRLGDRPGARKAGSIRTCKSCAARSSSRSCSGNGPSRRKGERRR